MEFGAFPLDPALLHPVPAQQIPVAVNAPDAGLDNLGFDLVDPRILQPPPQPHQQPQRASSSRPPQRAIGMFSTDDQIRARIGELEVLLNAELHIQVRVIHAILETLPEWQNATFEARSAQQSALWEDQVQTFDRLFRAQENVDQRNLDATMHRFPQYPMSRIRHLLDTQMRVVNGLPLEEMPQGREMRLRRTVLEAQLLTLRAWTRAWRERLPVDHPERMDQGEGGGAAGVSGGRGDGRGSGDVSDEELRRITEFGEYMDS